MRGSTLCLGICSSWEQGWAISLREENSGNILERGLERPGTHRGEHNQKKEQAEHSLVDKYHRMKWVRQKRVRQDETLRLALYWTRDVNKHLTD